MAGPASACRSIESSLTPGNEVSNQPVKTEVARCRAGMAELLTQTVATTRKLERRLGVASGWPEVTGGIDFGSDPEATGRIICGLLLRKARIHTLAVLQANETSNLHSLAV